jgi:hypothetical protein
MRLSQLAFLDFARLAPGTGFVPPDTFLSTFDAMAEQARIVHTRLPGGPGTVNITVGSQAWTVRRGDTADPHCKPYVRSIQHFQDPATPPEAGNAAPVSLLSQPPASLRR